MTALFASLPANKKGGRVKNYVFKISRVCNTHKNSPYHLAVVRTIFMNL
ncbi:hypothetical protein SAMN04488500_12461 [Sporomusa malonica]|uniref:Uncharacterized protein n=1 Tax=Sporomusa malonica TaxID=112901 RepID=A0A1W2EHR3_9FIRM|nr:hypothetical protein SAMN04488500_12461 [Sporomusa malonica]